MSKKRRADYIGCSVVERDGSLLLQARPRDGSGRKKLVRWRTGLSAEPVEREENKARLRPLQQVVGACVKAGRTKADIDAVLAQSLSAASATEGPVQVGPTLAEYYADWLAEQTPKVRKALARDYKRHFDSYILPTLGALPMTSLRVKDVRGLQADLLARPNARTGKPLAVKTVKNAIIGSFRALWRHALTDEELGLTDIFVGLTWPESEIPEPDPFTPEEVRRILAWFQAKRFGFAPLAGSYGIRRLPHPPFHAYVHLLFWSGLRPSEASGLQWQDIDLERGLLFVRRSYHLYTYQSPKTASARRTVELLPETVAVLRAIQPLRVEPDVPVFTTTTGKPIEPKTFSEHWYACLRALPIRVRGLYCTKDTYVSIALRASSVEWVEKQTGVAYSTLKKHYAKWIITEERPELERLRQVMTAAEQSADPEIDVPVEESETSIAATAGIAWPERVRGGGLEPE